MATRRCVHVNAALSGIRLGGETSGSVTGYRWARSIMCARFGGNETVAFGGRNELIGRVDWVIGRVDWVIGWVGWVIGWVGWVGWLERRLFGLCVCLFVCLLFVLFFCCRCNFLASPVSREHRCRSYHSTERNARWNAMLAGTKQCNARQNEGTQCSPERRNERTKERTNEGTQE